MLSWQGHGLALRLKGRMLNVSQTGALVLSEVLPPLDQRLRIRLEHPIRTDWYDAKVVRHGEGNEAGLRFEDCDPYALVLGGTMGIDVERSLIDIPDELRFSTASDSLLDRRN